MDGVQEIVQEVADERGRSVSKICVGNKDYLAKLGADEEKQEKEQARAQQVFEDMETKDREASERQAKEAAERARNRRRKQKRFQYTMLKRIKDDIKEEPLTSADDAEDMEESRKDGCEAQKKETVGDIYEDGGKIDWWKTEGRDGSGPED